MNRIEKILYPVSLFLIVLICSSWGYFHPDAPFWQYIVGSILILPVYWFLGRQKESPDKGDAQAEIENTIRLLSQSEQSYIKLVEFLPVPAIAHSQGIVTYVNRATMSILGGVSSDDIIGKSIYRFVAEEDRHRLKDQLNRVRTKSDEAIHFEEYTLVKGSGEKINVEATSMEFLIDEYGMVLTVLHDISYRKKEEEMVREMAYVCQLTQLPNRRKLGEALNKKIVDSKQKNQVFYLLFIDLDGFKSVNDTLGHEAGDAVLQMAAQRLSHCIRNRDFVSRYAGDEFIILLSDVGQEDAINIANRIILAMKSTMIIKGKAVNVTASIGISNFPQDGENAEELIKRADMAMYEAKQKGKNNFQIYPLA